jgi:hypothetical protein
MIYNFIVILPIRVEFHSAAENFVWQRLPFQSFFFWNFMITLNYFKDYY